MIEIDANFGRTLGLSEKLQVCSAMHMTDFGSDNTRGCCLPAFRPYHCAYRQHRASHDRGLGESVFYTPERALSS